jgi:hypothetical protein
MSTVSSSPGSNNAVGAGGNENSQRISADCSVADTTIAGVAVEIWSELVAASLVENPATVVSYYNDMVKNDDKSDFKLPSELTLDEYTKIPPKLTWNINVKYSKYSINMVSSEAPIRLCHLLIITAYRLKVFGEDAFGKVASRCKAAASVINYLLEQNRVFYPVTSGRQRIPARLRSLSDETFKSAIFDLVKCVVDTNLQRHYVGDGDISSGVSGFGLPTGALTSGSSPGAEALFKRALHEVKGLVDSKQYLKNPDSAEAIAERQQSALLNSINRVVNGDPPAQVFVSETTEGNEPLGEAASMAGNAAASIGNGGRMSPTSMSSRGTEDDGRPKLKSPAGMMAEASLLSQQAALKEASNFAEMLKLKQQEMEMKKEDAAISRKQREEEMKMSSLERESHTKVLAKLVERLCPEEDPTEKFMSRKRKLDDSRVFLGEELYQIKLQQLRDEFLKQSAL